jgi:GNAT superfamily N-acetyltransferase
MTVPMSPDANVPKTAIKLRPPQPGDYGWIIARHGATYAQSYGWDMSFEGLVAGLVADFVKNHDLARERCWIADLDGEPVGAVFCVRKDDETAQLRMLIVEEKARGLGAGGLLVDSCMAFARQAGYRRMTLWTNDILVPARNLYRARGWQLTSSKPHHSFGVDLVGEIWDVTL